MLYPPALCAGGCGVMLTRSVNSLPPGLATCRTCRSAGRAPQGARRVRADVQTEPCPVCSTPFLPKSSHGGLTQTCSHACAALKRTEGSRRRGGRVCEVCSATYTAKCARQRTCSRSCGLAIQGRRPITVKPYRPRECRICARSSQPGDTWLRYCSTQCRIDSKGVRVKDLYGAALALRLNGAGWLRLLMAYLRERDGDRCALCRRKIRFELKSGPRGHPSGMGPSIDHIVPRSVEVNDDPANLRLAHWRCNFDRKAGVRGEATQLALVG